MESKNPNRTSRMPKREGNGLWINKKRRTVSRTMTDWNKKKRNASAMDELASLNWYSGHLVVHDSCTGKLAAFLL